MTFVIVRVVRCSFCPEIDRDSGRTCHYLRLFNQRACLGTENYLFESQFLSQLSVFAHPGTIQIVMERFKLMQVEILKNYCTENLKICRTIIKLWCSNSTFNPNKRLAGRVRLKLFHYMPRKSKSRTFKLGNVPYKSSLEMLLVSASIRLP